MAQTDPLSRPRQRHDHPHHQRQQQVAFAPSHFVTNITAAVKKSPGITSFAQLNGKIYKNPNNKGV